MNYRTMVKGALALSLSLIVGSASAATTTYNDVQEYGATFENTAVEKQNDFAYALGSGITNRAYRLPADSEPTYGWFSGDAESDESKIIERTDEAAGQALQLNTDASTLTNKFSSTVAGAVNTALANEGTAFFETEVKFVPSDTPDAGIEGGADATKFAIYAYANEEVDPPVTNLVVFHAYQYEDENHDMITDYTNEVFSSVNIDANVYTTLRIEMKKLEVDEDAYQNVFSVSVNGGQPLTSDLALDKALDPTALGIWFQTIEDWQGNAENANVSSLNFKGTGEIDNIKAGTIAATTTYAIDWTGSQNVVVSNATAELTVADTNFTAGAVLTFYPTEGSITNVNGVAQDPVLEVYTYTVGEADAVVTVLAGIQVTPLDDTWTIEGFNPAPAVWPLPAAVSPDNKMLFYSNVVDNIDDANASIGRTIKAAWIGAKIIAPEAVTDETIANWKFDMAGAPGNSFASSNDGKENGHYVMNLWVPLTAAKIRTAIANHSDITYALDFYLDGGTTTQTLAMVISPKDIKLTNTDNVSDVEEIEVINWVEQGAASDDYEAGDDVGDATGISAGMATWLNGLKAAKNMTKEQFEQALDSDGISLYEEYLLNTDPTVATTVSFTVSSIAVGANVDLQVTLTRTENNAAVSAAINGVLKIYGAASLGGDSSFAVDQTLTDKFNGETTASKSFSTQNKFFKAVIEEAAE